MLVEAQELPPNIHIQLYYIFHRISQDISHAFPDMHPEQGDENNVAIVPEYSDLVSMTRDAIEWIDHLGGRDSSQLKHEADEGLCTLTKYILELDDHAVSVDDFDVAKQFNFCRGDNVEQQKLRYSQFFYVCYRIANTLQCKKTSAIYPADYQSPQAVDASPVEDRTQGFRSRGRIAASSNAGNRPRSPPRKTRRTSADGTPNLQGVVDNLEGTEDLDVPDSNLMRGRRRPREDDIHDVPKFDF